MHSLVHKRLHPGRAANFPPLAAAFRAPDWDPNQALCPVQHTPDPERQMRLRLNQAVAPWFLPVCIALPPGAALSFLRSWPQPPAVSLPFGGLLAIAL